MIRKLYSIHDKVAQDFSPVFEAKNDQCAARMFNNWLSQKIDEPGFDAHDYLLFRIGNMNDSYPCSLSDDFECISAQEDMEVSE